METINMYLPRVVIDHLNIKENDSFIGTKHIEYIFKIVVEE